MRRCIIVLLATITLICCNKEDDPDFQASNELASLVGKWSINTTELQLNVKGQPLKAYLMTNGLSEADAQKEVDNLVHQEGWEDLFTSFDFSSDGRWILETHTSTGTGEWKLTSDQKELTLTSDAEKKDRKANVIVLSATTLQIEMILGPSIQFGVSVDYSVLIKGIRSES